MKWLSQIISTIIVISRLTILGNFSGKEILSREVRLYVEALILTFVVYEKTKVLAHRFTIKKRLTGCNLTFLVGFSRSGVFYRVYRGHGNLYLSLSNDRS